MKKKLSIITLLLIIIWIIPQNVEAKTDTWYFVVTAYYSPLPNQKSYLTWNYEAEIRLNWQWIAWASWKKVFSGMLAWPKTYSFWTKIYLEGLGIWEISDRWGAIVSAWNRWYTHDRLDIWVGYWDEWLQRALYWWKRTVKWSIIDSNSKVNLDYTSMPSPNWTTTWLKPKEDVFSYSLWVWSDNAKIKKLKLFLKDLGLYNWVINWIYNDEIISIIYNFQIDNEILSSVSDSWAGYWGNITRDKFKKAYLNWEFDKVEELISEKIIEIKVEETKKEEKIKVDEIIENKIISEKNNQLSIFENVLSWAENTKKLQEILKELSLYNWEITGDYSDIVDSIYNFQLSENIIKSKNDIWAWNFWPKTRYTLKQKYLDYKQKLLEEEALRVEEEKRKQELEEKYREIEKSIIETVESKTKDLLWIKFWEVSPRVRNLQLTLKDLGYFNEKDTAIYWNKTKESLAIFQLENDLIDNIDSQYAWVLWERTLSAIKDKLEEKYLQSRLEWNEELLEFVNINNNTAL